MRLIKVFLVIFSCFALAQVAPEFPEPHQYFDNNLNHFDEIGYVFNRNTLIQPSKPGLAIAHQNREWEYNWFLFAFVLPFKKTGTVSIGYSNYGSNAIPITTADSVSASISEYSSDTFETFVVTYEPNISFISAQIIGGYKSRKLIDKKAKTYTVDVNLTSDYLLNNQLGVRTRNLISQGYKWGALKESLAKYVSLYYIQPVAPFTFLIEHDFCLNYDDLNMLTGQVSLALDNSISIFSSYRSTKYHSIFSYGSYIDLSEVFTVGYTNKNESNNNLDLSIHAINIGVKF